MIDRAQMKTDFMYSSFLVFSLHSFYIFLPYISLLGALAFIPLYCDERKSGFQRFSMYRISKRKYYLAKICASAFSAMAAIGIGLLLAMTFCYIAFPPINTYGATGNEFELEQIRQYQEFTERDYAYSQLCSIAGGLPAALLRVLYASLGAAVGAVLSLFISSFTANKYIALGLPVLFYDLYAKILMAIGNYDLLESLSLSGLTLPAVKTTGQICFYAVKIIMFIGVYSMLFYFNSKRRDKYGI